MAHLIDKDVLVAEIDDIESSAICEYKSQHSRYNEGCLDIIHHIKSFLNTLEVKEVDLEKEYDRYYDQERYIQTFKLAKHFFELGLKAKQG